MIMLLFENICAQHPVFYHLTEKDDLPDTEIYQVLEDNKGFIWIAANKGLFRYDGEKFINFNHPEKRGLSVFNLQLDFEGRIWCNNISGQYFFVNENKMELFMDIEKEVNSQLYQFYVKKNALIVNTSFGLISVNINTKKKKSIHSAQESFRQLHINNNSIYYIYDYKLRELSKSNNDELISDFEKYRKLNFTQWKILNFKNRFLVNAINSDDKNIKPHTFFGSKSKLKKVDFLNKIESKINNLKIIDNRLWVFTNNGLYVYNIKNDSLILEDYYFENTAISDVLKDKFNNYWITTLEDGVYIIPNLDLKKYDTSKITGNINALKNIDDEYLLFGSTKGIIGKIDYENEKVSILKSYNNNKVNSITQNNNHVYFGIEKTSLIFNKNTENFSYYNYIKNAKDISSISDSLLIYSLSSYCNLLDLKTNNTQILRAKRSYANFYSKSKKEIYVAYVDGFKKYDSNLKESSISFNNKSIFALDIDETDNGIIWISTFKDGVLGLKNGKAIINFTTDNGLISNRTNIIKADKNLLWISTDRGLQVLNTVDNTFKTYTKKEGISSFTIFDIEIFKNDIVFSSNDGVFKAKKQNYINTQKIPKFYFSSILIDDNVVPEKTSYILDSNNKSIRFNFKTNGFLAEENLRYKFQLLEENSDSKSWNVVPEKAKEITFNNLAAGNYKFNIKSYYIHDNQETKTKIISLTVKNPFYETRWFSVIVSLFLFGLILYFLFRRIKKLQRKQNRLLEKERLQKQLASTKLESLQSQMNPHFTFNALNSIQNLVLRGNRKDAYNYLNKYAELIRRNLNLSQKSFIPFEEELDTLEKYLSLEKLRFRDNFEYKISVDKSVKSIEIPTMIIQPFVENAIKHGLMHKIEGERKLEIYFFQEEVLECEIIDNGVGINASKEINKRNRKENSFSTKSIKEKLQFLKEFYNMDIGFTYEKVEEGTKVIIKIPYK